MREIFVFGSNLGGFHGAGAAKYAFQRKGAKLGVAVGLSGESYAIPTKDREIKYTLPLDVIQGYVNGFIAFAQVHPELMFQVTRIGCGLAGLHDREIAPMFERAPDNCRYDEAWKDLLPGRPTWGTF